MFKKAKQNYLVEDVVQQIEEAILDHNFTPGEKLPASKELAEVFGASRSTLRAALRVLGQKGLIETRPGVKGGIFVKEPTAQQISESLDLLIRYKRVSIEDLQLFREALEVPAAAEATKTATAEEIADLKNLLARLGEHLQAGTPHYDQFYEVDVLMHRALALMSRNLLFELLLLTIHNDDSIYNTKYFYQKYLPKDEDKVREAYEDWGQIVAALEKGQLDKVTSILRSHIQRFHRYVREAKARDEKGGQAG